jgi:hypothetical protein
LFRETANERRSGSRLHRTSPLHVAGYYTLSCILTSAESSSRNLCSHATNIRWLPSNKIRRVESAEVSAATRNDWRRDTTEDSLRGTEAPRPKSRRCAFRLEVLDYQRLPRSPRSPLRPPPPPWPPRPPPPPPWPPRPPPYPPRPPPPPPPRSAWGRASFTTRFRPPKF